MTTPDVTFPPPSEGGDADAQWARMKAMLDGYAFRYGGHADASDRSALGEPTSLRTFMVTGAQRGYDSYHWAIPDLLERRDKMVITGPSGHGKSTLLRQIALCAAGGVQPFAYGLASSEIPPLRVAYIDCENRPSQSWRALAGMVRRMEAQHGSHAAQRSLDNLDIHVREEGIDLLQGERQEALLRYLDAVEPDLVLIGSLYMLSSGDPNLEPVAAAVANCLRRITTTFDAALIVEAHSRKQPLTGPPVLDPQGANLWIKWPDFGRSLAPERDAPGLYRFAHFRGDREPRANLPDRLRLDWASPGMPWRAEHPEVPR